MDDQDDISSSVRACCRAHTKCRAVDAACAAEIAPLATRKKDLRARLAECCGAGGGHVVTGADGRAFYTGLENAPRQAALNPKLFERALEGLTPELLLAQLILKPGRSMAATLAAAIEAAVRSTRTSYHRTLVVRPATSSEAQLQLSGGSTAPRRVERVARELIDTMTELSALNAAKRAQKSALNAQLQEHMAAVASYMTDNQLKRQSVTASGGSGGRPLRLEFKLARASTISVVDMRSCAAGLRDVLGARADEPADAQALLDIPLDDVRRRVAACVAHAFETAPPKVKLAFQSGHRT